MVGLSTQPTAIGEFADAALNHVAAAMRPGWLVSRSCTLGIDGGLFSTRVQYALLHARVGIALLDVVPGTTTPDAADRLKQRLDAMGFAARFARNPPILYFCVPLRAIPDIGDLLEQEFGRQPSSALPSDDAWVATAQNMLSANPLETPGSQVRIARTSDHLPPRHPQNSISVTQGRRSGRLSSGARLLAGFWGLVTVSVGGGAMCLQYLGPPVEHPDSIGTMDLRLAFARDTFPVTLLALNQADTAAGTSLTSTSLAKADSPRAVAGAGIEALSPVADAPGSSDADVRDDLVENEQAIVKLQERLKRFEHAPATDAEPSLIASETPRDNSPAMPAMLQEDTMHGLAASAPAEISATLPARAPQLVIADAAPGPDSASLPAATAPVDSDGSPAEGAVAETLPQSAVETQALLLRDGNAAPPIAGDDVAATQSPPSSTSAGAPAEPAEAASTARPDEPGAIAAPSGASSEAAAPPPAVALPSGLPARVILHYARGSASAQTRAAALAQTLRAQGLEMANPVDLPATVATSGVIFFYADDRRSAEWIASSLGGPKPVQRRPAAGLPLPPPGTIEVAIAGF